MTNDKIAIALTGHRPNKLGGYDLKTKEYKSLLSDLVQFIKYQLEKYDEVWCHSGLALGADTVWSMAILQMKEIYPNRVFFHAEIPTMSQSEPWFKDSDINFWNKQIESADDKTIYDKNFESKSQSERKRTIGRILNDRNIGMIDHSDILLAIYDEKSKPSGGTKNAIDYAIRENKEIVRIDSNKYFN